jgi:hypothetical protein
VTTFTGKGPLFERLQRFLQLSQDNPILGVIERQPLLSALVCTLPYLVIAYLVCEAKMLWDDEFFTVYIARSPTLKDIWTALETGADQHPPFFYILTHFSIRLVGESHLAFRLPAIIGVWIMSMCLFAWVSRRTSTIFGLAAMFFVQATSALDYACEARGYGLMLGFSGLSVLSWQLAGEARWRRLAPLGIATGLAGAVASHYYSLLVVGPLVLGELVRSALNRRIHPTVWLSFLAPVVPLAIAAPLIEAAQGYSTTFWAWPMWRQPLTFYAGTAGLSLSILVILVTLGIVAFLVPRSKGTDSDTHSSEEGQQVAEMVVAIGLLALPLAGEVVAKLATNAWTSRYFLSSLFGLGIVLGLAMDYMFSRRRAVGLVVVSALAIVLCLRGYLTVVEHTAIVRQWSNHAKFLTSSTTDGEPVYVPEVTAFHRLSYYAPRSLAGRLVYPSDPSSARKYLNHDTIDKGLLALRPWFPLRVVEYSRLADNVPSYYLYGRGYNKWVWFYYRLGYEDVQATFVDLLDERMLMHVKQREGPETGKHEPLTALHKPLELSYGTVIDDQGPSLCREWTGDEICSYFP